MTENTFIYRQGNVTEVLQESSFPDPDTGQLFYTQEVKIKTQTEGGQPTELTIPVGNEFQPLTENQLLTPRDGVVLTTQPTYDGQTETIITDLYRMPILTWLAIGFLVLVFLIGRWRGLMSMLGMVLSLGILFWYVLPQIMAGQSPLLVSTVAATAIAVVTMYLSHGFNAKSHVALGSLLVTLFSVIALAWMSVQAAHLTGLGSEEAGFLQFGGTAAINLRGLLLGGIILGALGVLDDIVVSQVSVVEQLHAANPKLSFEELFNRGLSVGRDHVASLVNTLVLAYAGANLPLFVLFYQASQTPVWVTINNELVAEEIVRTLVGSTGLVLAVPLTTLVAAFVFKHHTQLSQKIMAHSKKSGHAHTH